MALIERFLPLRRSAFSLLEPNWKLGHWNDFGHIWREMDSDMKYMQDRMQTMVSQMHQMLPLDIHKDLSHLQPKTIDKDGTKQLQMQVSVKDCKPDSITVKVKDNVLTVCAKHEEKKEGHHSYREYHRQFVLPEGTDVDAVKSTLSPEGVLTIEAPLPPALELTKEKTIPIQHNVPQVEPSESSACAS